MCLTKIFQMKLEENETILEEIHHSNKIPLRLEDMLTIPFFTVFAFIFVFVTSNITDNKDVIYYFLYPIATIFVVIMTVGRIFLRWFKTKTRRFFLSNKRLIFSDKTGKIIDKSFPLKNLEISYRENLNGNGYIIIGKPEPLFQGRGINFFEDSDVIYNVNNVKKTFDRIYSEKTQL